MADRVKDREWRADYDPLVMQAFAEGRDASDIYVVFCSCGWWSYWNEGSHATCRNCDSDITACIEDSAMTMADYWSDAPYPCDQEAIS